MDDRRRHQLAQEVGPDGDGRDKQGEGKVFHRRRTLFIGVVILWWINSVILIAHQAHTSSPKAVIKFMTRASLL